MRLPPRSGLLPGEALRADIVVATRANAVTVPRAALLYAGEQAFLFIAAHEKALRRDVTIGVQEGDAIEIVTGVKAGEQVIVAGNAVLEDGMRIRTRPDSNPSQGTSVDAGVKR